MSIESSTQLNNMSDLRTIKNDPGTMGFEQWLQFLHEATNSFPVKLLWQLHDDYRPGDQHFQPLLDLTF